ncbi:LytR C-terminal domain-containing protein [Amycolatopsis sp. EV170708-02-1]|uniref:LytR C-terminal domain-containing protein n=1 Tax=Amycolatopsis sp. EV170708-02-1 TaxID=2919322 RepID=UPI001F0BA4C3|nr:LytR C-terminal domain-containing protein [Amycolatopsis sp. EV170708-02-1]UMP05661.1 LytR C-terminal domain-containing protein [Amycolatopsis sp. EV170708-02-1]
MSLFSGLSRPMKAAGLALVGVAVIAAVIGGITLTSGGGDSDTATPPGTTPTSSDGATQPSSPAPGSPPASTPPASSSAPPSSAPPSSAPPSSQPGQTGQPGQPGGDQQASHKWVTVRVYNNSTIQGLAEQAAKDFRASGWNVSEVKGYPGRLPETVAYYRPGTDEEAAAKALALEFGFRAEPRFKEIENIGPGVIVILTKDYKANDKDGS